MSKIRVRTHANPLSYPEPILRKSWEDAIDSKKPLIVDMGCGQGEFLVKSAKNNPQQSYLGIELRKPMSDKVNEKIKQQKLTNAICITGNASVSLKTLFKKNEIKELHINFPDPWIKPKHHKRRMIKNFVVNDLLEVIADDGIIYLLTDVKEIYDDFSKLLKEKFKEIPYKERKEKSYWEKWHEEKKTEMYKACFKK